MCSALWFGSRANYSDEQWQMIVDRFREERLPVDMIVLDSLSLCKVVWAGYDRDLEQMPDLKGFLAWMKQRGIKATINEHYDPLTRVNDSNFETIRKAMGMPENTQAIPHDISNKKYAALFMDRAAQARPRQGLGVLVAGRLRGNTYRRLGVVPLDAAHRVPRLRTHHRQAHHRFLPLGYGRRLAPLWDLLHRRSDGNLGVAAGDDSPPRFAAAINSCPI